MALIVRPLTQEAFAPYGDVIAAPADPGRTYFDAGLGNGRPAAPASLSIVLKAPADALPFRVELLERHEFSSQTFVPLDVSRWLVLVCPHAAGGGPDISRARRLPGRAGPGRHLSHQHMASRPDGARPAGPFRHIHVARRHGGGRGVRDGGSDPRAAGRLAHRRERVFDGLGTAARLRRLWCQSARSEWPNGARIALNFVINYEEGSEPSMQDGEGYTEVGLTEAQGRNQGCRGATSLPRACSNMAAGSASGGCCDCSRNATCR